MSFGWATFITVLSVLNIAGCLWLLWWTAKKRADEPTEADTTSHVWDDDIREYNKPLPRWWLNLFYATIVFAAAYLALFPGLGLFAGMLGWTSDGEHAQAAAEADAKLAPTFAKYRDVPVAQLAHDERAVTLGRAVFANHCATCHGTDARGAKGFPNLTDGDWLWGGDPDTVHATILDGRTAAMPALGAALGDKGITAVAVYVQSLSGTKADPTLAAQGERTFATICAACHGADGKGNVAMGAPNLADDVWLYGGSFDAIAETIRLGRNGAMPAHRPLIGEDRARLAAAYVVAQSLDQGGGASSAVRTGGGK